MGALGLGGLTLADMLRSRAAAAAEGRAVKDTSVLLVYLGGGSSHIDMWDLKPDAPAEIRGEFKPIDTSLPAARIGEHLPHSARQMHRCSLLRSVTHRDNEHGSASHYVLTGYAPLNPNDAAQREQDRRRVTRGHDAFLQKAFDMVTSTSVQGAFDLRREDAKTRDRYGRTTFGQGLLLGRRLVEAGVTFVTVKNNGWDTHQDNFNTLKKSKLPEFDRPWAALLDDLYARGLDKRVLVVLLTEFGRSWFTSSNGGREHWAACNSVIFAGGGLKMGQVIGVSDAKAAYPKERPISPEDLIATMYHVLGVNPETTYANEAGRPVKAAPTPASRSGSCWDDQPENKPDVLRLKGCCRCVGQVANLRIWQVGNLPRHSKRAPGLCAPRERVTCAEDADHWAFRFAAPNVPTVQSADLVRTPSDAFPLHKLEERKLTFAADADRLVLLRRASFDLIGLPPSLEEIDAFLADTSPDAYERMIDRLLASPHYGERWGRHWLDAAGYADTIKTDNDVNGGATREGMWRYRDYIVRALNADRPHDRMLLEQLAGDRLHLVKDTTFTAEEKSFSSPRASCACVDETATTTHRRWSHQVCTTPWRS